MMVQVIPSQELMIKTLLSFTTADVVSPTLSSSIPADNATKSAG